MNSKAANSEVQFLNLHQDLINGCIRGDQKAQFQIYKLYYKSMFEGYDHEEIGEILSIPSSTSRSQFSRARKRVIRELKSI